MAAFTLGTSPLFLLLALLATRLSRVAHRIFQPVAALTIVIVAGMSMVSGARLLGYGASWVSGDVVQSTVVADAAGAPTWQEATVNVLETAYEPARLQLKAGLPTRLQLVTDGVTGCMRSFTVPAMGIDTVLPVTGEEIIELPAAEPGDYVFACGMAMFSGAIEVIQ
jgi:plastocyanin domain-containing protein